ncbi:polysaccharide biosynthesis protein [Rhodosalinus sp. FB01]|uniref:polysaccharide biosynthesis protein n=1 Tax=Rhodosalinus sp. FB01 TaxID=3239194 RepID=UPI0035262D33
MLYLMVSSLSRSQKGLILLALDASSIVAAYFLALALAHSGLPEAARPPAALPVLAVMVALGVALSLHLGLHRVKLNAYELQRVLGTAGVGAAMGMTGVAVNVVSGGTMPASVFVIFTMTFVILSGSARLLLREMTLWIYRTGQLRKRVLIYGAGKTGQQLAAALAMDDALLPVAFLDDNPTLQSLTIADLKVHSPIRLPELVRERRIDSVIIAMPSASPATRARITRLVRRLGCEVHTLPSFAQLVLGRPGGSKLTEAQLYGLLGRGGMEPKVPGMAEAYRDRSILVTGAGGSIGSELCRQILSYRPRRLVLLDHAELPLFNLERELSELDTDTEILAVLGSVCVRALVDRVLCETETDVVLHAAAYKHLGMVEENAVEGLRTNVLGTKVVADAARDAGVGRFILISSDKAVRPASVLGASKRLAEMIVQDLATRSTTTRFSMVRFGNVIGSSGSVIPLFEEQIARGGPVTVTHRDVTRYFMTVSEAVHLVLLAGALSRGGDLFALDMGAPVSILQVARQMIEGAGYTVRDAETPHGDVEIRFTGLRPGEKMHEELLTGSEMLTTPHPKILRTQEGHVSELEMANALRDIRAAVEAQDAKAAHDAAMRWVGDRGVPPRGTGTAGLASSLGPSALPVSPHR